MGNDFQFKEINLTQFLMLNSIFMGRTKFTRREYVDMTMSFFTDMGEEEISCETIMGTLGILLSCEPEDPESQQMKALYMLPQDYDEDEPKSHVENVM